MADKTNILVVFHSTGGATWRLAQAVADGAAAVPDCAVDLMQVAELSQADRIQGPDFEQKRAPFADVPIASPDRLPDYDGIAIGSPVHFGSMSAALRTFLDQTGAAWMAGRLIGKPATVFVGAGSGGGRETAILSLWALLGTHGMIIVPPGLRSRAVTDLSAANGASPLGAGTVTGGSGERPSGPELEVARCQGEALAETAQRLKT